MTDVLHLPDSLPALIQRTPSTACGGVPAPSRLTWDGTFTVFHV